MAENIFLGLQPYTEDDAYRFKGRAEESQELFRLVVRNDFTVCYAESGEGKTSLLNAGVFPLLRENMYFPITITFTSDDYQVTPDSFDSIIDRCINDSVAEYNEKNKGVNVEYKLFSTDFQGLDCQAELQRELSKYSWWKLRNYKPQAMGLTFIPVFIFDQFEEVFNMPGSIVWTKKFFDWLEDVSSDTCPEDIAKKVRTIIGDKTAFPAIKEEKGFKAVFSLRKEFIGELDYWGMQRCFIPALKDNRYCLKPLTCKGAKKVMAQLARFDSNQIEQVLTYFVQQYTREPKKTIEENLPVIPALLLSVVGDSWEKNPAYFVNMGADAVAQSLNVVLEKFYDDTIADVVSKLSANKNIQQSARIHNNIDSAMLALVDANGKRVRAKTTSSVLSQMNFDAQYKKVLSDYRIIKVSKIDGEDYVELVHDKMADVVYRRRIVRSEVHSNKRYRVVAFGIALVAIVILAFALFHVDNNSTHPFFSSNYGYTTSTINGGALSGNQSIECLRLLNPAYTEIKNCSNLEMIEVQYVGGYDEPLFLNVFNCPSLRNIKLNKGVTTIGCLNIDGSPYLNSIKLPSTLYHIEYGALPDNGDIKFDLSQSNSTRFLWENDCLWEYVDNDDIYDLRYVKSPRYRNVIIFPDSLRKINHNYYNAKKSEYNFSIDNNTLHFVYLKDSILNLTDERFANVTKVDWGNNRNAVKEIILSQRVDSIDFSYCRSLQKIVFADSSSLKINYKSFNGCDKLDSIIFGHYQNGLPQVAFSNARSLKYVKLPVLAELEANPYGGVHLPHFQTEIQDNSCFKKEYGVTFWKDVAFSSESDDYTESEFTNSIYFIKSGVLNKKNEDGTCSIVDIPSSVDFRRLRGMRMSDNQKYAGESITKIGNNVFFITPDVRRIVDGGNSILITFITEYSGTFMTSHHTDIEYLKEICDYRWFVNRVEDLMNIEEVHTLSRLPDDISTDGVAPASRLVAILPESIKKNATLFVPMGSRKYYLNHPLYSGYKEILEDDYLFHFYQTIKYIFLSSFPLFWVAGYPVYIALLVLILFLIISILVWRKLKNKDSLVLFLLKLLISISIWFFVYWNVNYRFNSAYNWDLVFSNIIALILAIVIFTILSFPRQVITFLLNLWAHTLASIKIIGQFAKQNLKWICLFIILVFFGVCVFFINENNKNKLADIQELRLAGCYAEAAVMAHTLLPRHRQLNVNNPNDVSLSLQYQDALYKILRDDFSFSTVDKNWWDAHPLNRKINNSQNDFICLSKLILSPILVDASEYYDTKYYRTGPRVGFISCISLKDCGQLLEVWDRERNCAIDTLWTEDYTKIRMNHRSGELLIPILPNLYEVRNSELEIIDTIPGKDIVISSDDKWIFILLSQEIDTTTIIGTLGGKWHKTKFRSELIEIRNDQLEVIDTIFSQSPLFYRNYISLPQGPNKYIYPTRSDVCQVRDEQMHIIEEIPLRSDFARFAHNGKYLLTGNVNEENHYVVDITIYRDDMPIDSFRIPRVSEFENIKISYDGRSLISDFSNGDSPFAMGFQIRYLLTGQKDSLFTQNYAVSEDGRWVVYDNMSPHKLIIKNLGNSKMTEISSPSVGARINYFKRSMINSIKSNRYIVCDEQKIIYDLNNPVSTLIKFNGDMSKVMLVEAEEKYPTYNIRHTKARYYLAPTREQLKILEEDYEKVKKMVK